MASGGCALRCESAAMVGKGEKKKELRVHVACLVCSAAKGTKCQSGKACVSGGMWRKFKAALGGSMCN